MNFLGRKLHGKCEGEIASDLSGLVCRCTGGSRIKHRVKENWQDAAARRCAGFNPLARQDVQLFQSVVDGAHCLKGFPNRDIRARLQSKQHLREHHFPNVYATIAA